MDSREQSSWVLRHIGPPATITESVEVVELKLGATTFGRGATADVYIDSLVLRNFISRRHAVVVGEKDHNDQLHFILHNHGLNGTYVNDVRMGAVQHLHDGDRVIFGHKNGYKVKVGETAVQPDSEFQFVLERWQPTKSSIAPLQEHRRQAGTRGGSHLSDGDNSETPVCFSHQNGQSFSSDVDQQLMGSSTKKGKGSDLGNTHEGHSRSPSKTPSSAAQRPGSPKPGQKTAIGTKGKSYIGKGSPKVKEVCATKENKVRSKSPRRKQVDEERRAPSRRHSDDGVPQSFQHKINQRSSRQSSTIADGRRSLSPESKQSPVGSSSPSCKASAKSWSPKHSEKTKGRSRSPMANDRSRSPREDSKNWPCLSPQGVPAGGRLESSGPASPDNSSVSPRPDLADKGLKSKCSSMESDSRHGSAERRSGSAARSESWSRSPSRDDRRSPSVYDDPPVLIPEYVKTPSSVVRSPSPCIYIERAEDTECDEVDDLDRDSLLCSIPPTPGHSFHELSPAPHSSKRDASPLQRIRDSSPHRRSWDASSWGKRNEVGSSEHDIAGSRKREVSPPLQHEVEQYSRLKDRLSGRDALSHSKRKDDTLHDQKKWHNIPSLMEHHCVEPDSTTSKCKDSFQSDSASEVKKQSREGDREQPDDKQRKPEADVDDNLFFNSHDSLVQRDCQGQTKGKRKDLASPVSVVDRNVFDRFSMSEFRKSSLNLAEKRPHSVECDSGEELSWPRPKSAKLHPKPCKSLGEKENGLSLGCESLSRHTGYAEKSREKRQSDGKLLKDVRVTVQRVATGNMSPAGKPNLAGGGDKRQQCTSTSDGRSAYRDKSKQSSGCSKGSKPGARGEKGRADSSRDTSLFGLEMERLSSVQRNEKPKARRERTLPPKAASPASAYSTTPKEKERGKRAGSTDRSGANRGKRAQSMDRSVTDRGREKLKASSRDKSNERKPQRDRSANSRSRTPDQFFSSDERERSRPVRKIAMRRPRQGKDIDNNKTSLHKDNEVEERKPGRLPKKQKRRRKKGDDGDEEDESLEDGVTWYEEETCESDHCYRPAERRVQWVCCDDCDKWYHTVCVGIYNLEDLKDEDYHCGCV